MKAIKVNNTIELCYIVIIHVSYIHVKQLHESFITIVLHTNKTIPVYNIKHVGLYRPEVVCRFRTTIYKKIKIA